MILRIDFSWKGNGTLYLVIQNKLYHSSIHTTLTSLHCTTWPLSEGCVGGVGERSGGCSVYMVLPLVTNVEKPSYLRWLFGIHSPLPPGYSTV